MPLRVLERVQMQVLDSKTKGQEVMVDCLGRRGLVVSRCACFGVARRVVDGSWDVKVDEKRKARLYGRKVVG